MSAAIAQCISHRPSAPAVGELLAKSILTNTLDPLLVPFAIDPFDRGAAVREEGIVLATGD
jgi:hypothetical protein